MVHKITLMEAYLIETARKAGVSNEEMLLKAERDELSSLNKLHKSFDFTELSSLANKGNIFKAILEEGYKIKFLTYPGLVNLLKLKFNKIEGEDFIQNENFISNLQVKDEELMEIKTFLSDNWVIVEQNEGIQIKPLHK